MGGSGSVLGADATLLWSNPAACAGLAGPALLFAGAVGQAGTTTGKIGFAWPVSRVAISGGIAGYSGGSIDLEATDGSLRTVSARQEWVALLGIAGPLPYGGTGGISLKTVRSELLGEFGAHSYLADVGVQYLVAGPVKVGLAIRDWGSSLRYLAESFPPPTRIVAGAVAGWRYPSGEAAGLRVDQLIAAADVRHPAAGGRTTAAAGFEARWFGTIALRAGVGTKDDGSFAGAVGLAFLHGRYRFEYGFQVVTRGDFRPHMFSLAVDL